MTRLVGAAPVRLTRDVSTFKLEKMSQILSPSLSWPIAPAKADVVPSLFRAVATLAGAPPGQAVQAFS
eukprot:CAMPEP_0185790278 /NCGR_PEP_ID=MMETSP1174-20130828/155357_1 /TAXON_ID=35687 /ORGANISM="Dictyocha speculum, Strain CCMP1381" /LENGTH=67 /DNA_ID=CAMNT_0028484875 /DNA_START=77 /DNA_END=277 /DNA_ORIENTATION=-